MAAFDSWVGPPAIVYDGRVVDGAIRSEAWSRLGYAADPPTAVAANCPQLVRLLVFAGEHAKAERMLGDKFDDRFLARHILRLSSRECAPLVEPRRKYSPRQMKSCREHLRRVVALYWSAVEAGSSTVSIDELWTCLEGAPSIATP